MKKLLLLSNILCLFFSFTLAASELKIKRKSPDFKTSEKDNIEKKKYVEKKKWKWKKLHTKKGESLITSSGVEYAGITYIDESTISETIVGKKKYKTRSFYNLVNLANQVGNSSSIIFETTVDCKTKKYINDYMQFFSEPFGKGIPNMHKDWESSIPNNFWNKGTRMHSLGEYACKVKPASTSNITSILSNNNSFSDEKINWEEFAENKNTKIYANMDNFSMSSNIMKIEFLLEFKEKEKDIKSIRQKTIIDCKNEKYAAQKTVSYGGSMATNKLRTTEYKIQDLKWKPISSNPGNVVRTAFENCY